MGRLAGSVGNQGFVFTPGMGPPRPSQLETKSEKRQKAKRQAVIKAEWDAVEANRQAQEEIDCIANRFLPMVRDNLLRRERRELIAVRQMSAVERLKTWHQIYGQILEKPADERAKWLKPEHA